MYNVLCIMCPRELERRKVVLETMLDENEIALTSGMIVMHDLTEQIVSETTRIYKEKDHLIRDEGLIEGGDVVVPVGREVVLVAGAEE